MVQYIPYPQDKSQDSSQFQIAAALNGQDDTTSNSCTVFCTSDRYGTFGHTALPLYLKDFLFPTFRV